jgi:hypothetical protein
LKRRLDVSDDELQAAFWLHHPRSRFIKSLPLGATVFDIGAGEGGLPGWAKWLNPPRPDLAFYGLDHKSAPDNSEYAGWEVVDLDERLPKLEGINPDAFYAAHLIEHLRDPWSLLRWMACRSQSSIVRVYLEWPNPERSDLPRTHEIREAGVDVMISHWLDDHTHKIAPRLAEITDALAGNGFEVVEGGSIDLGLLAEELYVRSDDLGARTIAFWCMTRWSNFVVACKGIARDT